MTVWSRSLGPWATEWAVTAFHLHALVRMRETSNVAIISKQIPDERCHRLISFYCCRFLCRVPCWAPQPGINLFSSNNGRWQIWYSSVLTKELSSLDRGMRYSGFFFFCVYVLICMIMNGSMNLPRSSPLPPVALSMEKKLEKNDKRERKRERRRIFDIIRISSGILKVKQWCLD